MFRHGFFALLIAMTATASLAQGQVGLRSRKVARRRPCH
jgi:hypothetical protein